MKVTIRADSVEIDGYVNAIERNSKPLWSRVGQFVERICKGAFASALSRNNNVRIMLNHSKDLGGQQDGNLELTEDAIGLRFHTVIADKDVINDARNGNLIGCSFGFYDREVEKNIDPDTGLPLREVRDLDLEEVSILNRDCEPAYDGTLVMVRADGEKPQMRAEIFADDVELVNETEGEPPKQDTVDDSIEDANHRNEEPEQTKESDGDNTIDYSKYENMISEMKGD